MSDLPPLDGEVDESSDPEIDVDDEQTPVPLDDGPGDARPGEDADFDPIDGDENERSWLSEETDSEDLDLGAGALCDIGAEGSLLPESDEAESPGDGDQEDDSEEIELDGGEEGPLAPDDELRDEDLPALDADGDGEFDDKAFMDDRFAAEGSLGLPWAMKPWDRVGAPLELDRATAVACVPRGALVAARAESRAPELFRVDLEGSREPMSPAGGLAHGPLTALAVHGTTVAGICVDGRLVISHDGGSHFEETAHPLTLCDALYCDALYSGRTLWLRSASGVLFASNDDGRSVLRCRAPGPVVAMARDGSGSQAGSSAMAALVVDEAAHPIALLYGDDGARVARQEDVDAPSVGVPVALAVRGRHVAFASPSGVACRTAEDRWQSFAWEGRITAIAFVDDEGTLLAATYAPADDTTGLIRLDRSGRASVVARVGAAPRQSGIAESLSPRGDGRVVALACDDARGVVWAVGDFGVAAFAVASC